MQIYILMDDHTPDVGSSIYGVFATYDLAQAKLDELSREDNEYGCNMNKFYTIDIHIEDVIND